MKNDEPLAICSIRDESRKGTIILYYGMTKEVVQCIHSIIRARECQLDDAGIFF